MWVGHGMTVLEVASGWVGFERYVDVERRVRETVRSLVVL